MSILLSDEEIQAMEGLPHLHRCLYIFGIRKHMDYRTGLTGIKRKISYKSLAEEVYVVPHQGYTSSGTVSREALRRAVKALEKAGLITVNSNDKNLILKCNLARQDKSVQNKPDTNPTPQPDTEADTLENEENYYKNRFGQVTAERKPDTEADIPKNTKPDTHPVSDRLDKIRLDSVPVDNIFESGTPANAIYQLLTKRGYYVNHMHHQKTLAMINAFVKAGITPDEAEIGFKHCDSQANSKPSVPWYYEPAVYQYKANLAASLKKSQEIKPNEITTTRQSATASSLSLRERRRQWALQREQEEAAKEQSGLQDD